VKTYDFLRKAKGDRKPGAKYTRRWRDKTGAWRYEYPDTGGRRVRAHPHQEPPRAPAGPAGAPDHIQPYGAELAQLRADHTRLQEQIKKLEGQMPGDPTGGYWSGGQVGGSGNRKHLDRLNRQKDRDLDKVIDLSKKLTPLYQEARDLEQKIAHIESGARHEQEQKQQARAARVAAVQVGDVVQLGDGSSFFVEKINPASVVLRSGKTGTTQRVPRSRLADVIATGAEAEAIRNDPRVAPPAPKPEPKRTKRPKAPAAHPNDAVHELHPLPDDMSAIDTDTLIYEASRAIVARSQFDPMQMRPGDNDANSVAVRNERIARNALRGRSPKVYVRGNLQHKAIEIEYPEGRRTETIPFDQIDSLRPAAPPSAPEAAPAPAAPAPDRPQFGQKLVVKRTRKKAPPAPQGTQADMFGGTQTDMFGTLHGQSPEPPPAPAAPAAFEESDGAWDDIEADRAIMRAQEEKKDLATPRGSETREFERDQLLTRHRNEQQAMRDDHARERSALVERQTGERGKVRGHVKQAMLADIHTRERERMQSGHAEQRATIWDRHSLEQRALVQAHDRERARHAQPKEPPPPLPSVDEMMRRTRDLAHMAPEIRDIEQQEQAWITALDASDKASLHSPARRRERHAMIANHQDDRREMQARHAQKWHDLLTQQHREQLQQGTAATDLHQGQRAALMTNQSDEIGALIGSQNRDRGLIAQRHEQMRKEERNPPRPRQQPRPAPAPAPAPKPATPEAHASPGGTPVSQAFRLASGRVYQVGMMTLQAIDAVHGDGRLPKIPINPTRKTKDGVGFYRAYGHAPHDILINPQSNNPHIYLTHEIGHFLDHQAMGGGGQFASELHPDFQDFRDAVAQTESIQQLHHLKSAPQIPGFGRNAKAPREYISYLLQRREIWARAYSQYIAIRSGDPRMLAELRRLQNDKSPMKMQWDDADFEPVAAAIDKILEKKGWKPPQ
jgi:hypothetical protein